MKRYDIINKFIKKKKLTSYLEIGTQKNVCLNQVNCKFKAGVDPEPLNRDHRCNEFHKMTSDTFFSKNKRRFDLIFIDGLHHREQVYKDAKNALEVSGLVLFHDCNPQKFEHQQVPRISKHWNGDVWIAWMRLRNEYETYTIDTDEGIGVIGDGGSMLFDEFPFDFKAFRKKNKYWLNLISEKEWLTLLI